MITLENHLGTIEISQEYFSNLIGHAVSSCYGVAGMVKTGAKQGIRSLLFRRTYADEVVLTNRLSASSGFCCTFCCTGR